MFRAVQLHDGLLSARKQLHLDLIQGYLKGHQSIFQNVTGQLVVFTGRRKLRHACGAFAGCLPHRPLRFPWLMGLFWADLVPPFCALDLPDTQMLL